MKKILGLFLITLSACSAQNTPDFVLKHTDNDAYNIKQLIKECETNNQNRVIQVDGVVGYYDYNSNNASSCSQIGQDALGVYQNPERHAIERDDVKPLTH